MFTPIHPFIERSMLITERDLAMIVATAYVNDLIQLSNNNLDAVVSNPESTHSNIIYECYCYLQNIISIIEDACAELKDETLSKASRTFDKVHAQSNALYEAWRQSTANQRGSPSAVGSPKIARSKKLIIQVSTRLTRQR